MVQGCGGTIIPVVVVVVTGGEEQAMQLAYVGKPVKKLPDQVITFVFGGNCPGEHGYEPVNLQHILVIGSRKTSPTIVVGVAGTV